MKIGVLGSGMVGQTISAKLAELGHDVRIGTRDVAVLMARMTSDEPGTPAFPGWLAQHPTLQVATFADTAAHGDLLFNATSGTVSLAALRLAGAENLAGKVLIDLANPLDFSQERESLSVCNTDSLGEQIQRAFPQVKVVKTLNTITARVMVNPRLVADGDHTVFVAGNDAAAKTQVIDILQNWFGWRDVIDLGDIDGARGMEMILPLWLELYGALHTSIIGFKVVRRVSA